MTDTTPPAGRPPKTMSSRLMTMKFMQRAAAGSRASISASTTNSPVSTPKNDRSAPSSPSSSANKRQKPNSYSPSTTAVSGLTSLEHDMKRAVEAEEAKRQEALGKLQAGSGETRWVFAYREDGGKGKGNGALGGVRILGFGEEDPGGAEEGGEMEEEGLDHAGGDSDPWSGEVRGVGRMRFGVWKEDEDKRTNNSDSNSESSSDDEDNDANNSEENGDANSTMSPNGSRNQSRTSDAAKKARAALKAKRKAEATVLRNMSGERRKKEVNLNQPVEIEKLEKISSKRENRQRMYEAHDYRKGKT